MKKILLATVSAVVLATPVMAQDRFAFKAPLIEAGPPAGDSNARYFHPMERVLSPLIKEQFRYPRPDARLSNFDIPDHAGAPVPIDPVSLVGPYAQGDASVPLGARRVVGHARDAKGDARRDARGSGRAAW